VIIVTSQEAVTPFSFYDYLLGEWDVARGTATLGSGEQTFETVIRGKYFFEKENGTMNLLGRYYDNDTSTGEVMNEMSVVVEFSTPTEGVFKVSGANDDSPHPLFAFDFEQAAINGLALAYGAWRGDKTPTYYQFVVTSWDRFAITLIPHTAIGSAGTSPTAAGASPAAARLGKSDDDADTDAAESGPTVALFLGKKVPVIAERGFFQKYGSMLMIGVFLIIQMKMRGFGGGGQAAAAQAQAQAGQRRRTAQDANVAGIKKEAGSTTASTSTPKSPAASSSEAAADKPHDE